MWILMLLELVGLIPVLVLFGIAQPDLYRTKMWQIGFDNGFKVQWEDFLRHVAGAEEGSDYPYDFLSGARGVRLAEAGLASSAEGRRITLDPLTEV